MQKCFKAYCLVFDQDPRPCSRVQEHRQTDECPDDDADLETEKQTEQEAHEQWDDVQL